MFCYPKITKKLEVGLFSLSFLFLITFAFLSSIDAGQIAVDPKYEANRICYHDYCPSDSNDGTWCVGDPYESNVNCNNALISCEKSITKKIIANILFDQKFQPPGKCSCDTSNKNEEGKCTHFSCEIPFYWDLIYYNYASEKKGIQDHCPLWKGEEMEPGKFGTTYKGNTGLVFGKYGNIGSGNSNGKKNDPANSQVDPNSIGQGYNPNPNQNPNSNPSQNPNPNPVSPGIDNINNTNGENSNTSQNGDKTNGGDNTNSIGSNASPTNDSSAPTSLTKCSLTFSIEENSHHPSYFLEFVFLLLSYYFIGNRLQRQTHKN